MKVWREPGWDEGESLAWRAQIYDAKGKVASVIGAGPTRDVAIWDCLVRFDPPESGAEWLSLDEARAIADSVPHG